MNNLIALTLSLSRSKHLFLCTVRGKVRISSLDYLNVKLEVCLCNYGVLKLLVGVYKLECFLLFTTAL